MKDWLNIGQFAKVCDVSTKALRLYEEIGLLEAAHRGENNYRNYNTNQIELIKRIKLFQNLGFSLKEIKTLLGINVEINAQQLQQHMTRRLQSVDLETRDLFDQKIHIKKIISELNKQQGSLEPSQRRYIMRQYEDISIVVTGLKNLDQTALQITRLFKKDNRSIETIEYTDSLAWPTKKPFVLCIAEDKLNQLQPKNFMPDIVVINNSSTSSVEKISHYLNLYSAAGPHMATIFNADDSPSVELAANEEIRKGKTFYYSKNSALDSQIKKIGGLVSDGNEFKIYGFNNSPSELSIKLPKALEFDVEISLLSALTALLEVGLTEQILL